MVGSGGADGVGSQDRRLSVLRLADDCTPDGPSLPIVGY